MFSVYSVLNPTINWILGSPAHRILSSRVMTVRYQGRKSGKPYATPVSYYREGNRVYCFTNGRWWHNFKETAPVSLRVRGENLAGHAIAAPANLGNNSEIMARYFKAVKADAKFYGVTYDLNGNPNMGTVNRASMGMVMISVSLS